MAGTATKKEKKTSYTYEDYLNFDDDERYEIIDGELYNMSPAPCYTHQNIAVELITLLHTFFRGKPCKVVAAPFDVRLSTKPTQSRKIKTTVQPDISIICDEEKIDEKGCMGAPDLIIEIISPSTASRDHIVKKALYEKYGVKEYWLVDPINRITTIYRLGNKTKYGAPEIFDDQAKVDIKLFPGLNIDFATVFPPLKKNTTSKSE